MPISVCLVLLEVYFNYPLELLKLDMKWASYGQNTKTGQNRAGCTGTGLTSTGTGSVLLTCTGTGSRCTGTGHPKMLRMCVFVSFFHIFLPHSTLYSINTSKPLQIHLIISFLLKLSFITYLSSKIFHEFLPKPF